MKKKNSSTQTKRSKKGINVKGFEDNVKKRAFEIFQERQQEDIPGDELSDWFQAEQELRYSNEMD